MTIPTARIQAEQATQSGNLGAQLLYLDLCLRQMSRSSVLHDQHPRTRRRSPTFQAPVLSAHHADRCVWAATATAAAASFGGVVLAPSTRHLRRRRSRCGYASGHN